MIYYMVRRFRIKLKSCFFVCFFFTLLLKVSKKLIFETLNVVMLLKLATVGPSGLSIIGVL